MKRCKVRKLLTDGGGAGLQDEVHCFCGRFNDERAQHSATLRHKPSDDLLQPKSIVLFYNAENLINKKKKSLKKFKLEGFSFSELIYEKVLNFCSTAALQPHSPPAP